MGTFFGNFNLKTTLLLKSGLNFDEAAKLGKASKDPNDQGGGLILQHILNEWVAEGVAFNIKYLYTSLFWYSKNDGTNEGYSSVFCIYAATVYIEGL